MPIARKPAAPARRRAAKKSAAPPERPKIVVEDLSDFNESLNILVYGDSGVGKTPFAGVAPKGCFISTEKGTISAKRFGSTAKLIRATTWELLEGALDYIDANPDEFEWIILDSLTKMQVLLMRHILQQQNAENASRDLDIPALQDHQKWQNMFKRFVDRIIDMPVNTIFIATAMHREDAEGEDLVLPHIEGKDYAIAQYVCAQMDAVYCLKVKSDRETGKPYWRLLTQTRPPYFAKDRYNAFDKPVVDYPVMTDVIKAIQDSALNGSGPVPSSAPKGRKSSILDDQETETDTLDDSDDADDDWEDDEPEPAPKPVKRTAQRRTSARASQARTAKVRDAEEESEEPAEEETPAQKAAAREKRRPGKAEKPVDEFDPDDDDLDFED